MLYIVLAVALLAALLGILQQVTFVDGGKALNASGGNPMTNEWTQLDSNHWRDEVQTPTDKLTAEIIKDPARPLYSVSIRGTALNQGLTLPAIKSLKEAKEVGEGLIKEFTTIPSPNLKRGAGPGCAYCLKLNMLPPQRDHI